MKIKSLKLDSKIKYKFLHENFGRAEFSFCLVRKYGKVKKVYIQRIQQGNQEIFCLDLERLGINVTSHSFESWSNYNNPRPWRMGWCKEHKAEYTRVYVPENTNTLKFRYHFGTDLTFHFNFEKCEHSPYKDGRER